TAKAPSARHRVPTVDRYGPATGDELTGADRHFRAPGREDLAQALVRQPSGDRPRDPIADHGRPGGGRVVVGDLLEYVAERQRVQLTAPELARRLEPKQPQLAQ